MNHLFFVAVAVGIFSGTTISAKAQTSVNAERLMAKTQAAKSPKFINDIELNPEGTMVAMAVEKEKITSPVSVNMTANASTVNIEQLKALQFKYAMLMDREVESVSNYELYNFIDDWWGTRYRYGGDTKKGIDCSAFTSKLMSTVYGIECSRTAQDQYDESEKISRDDLNEGDFVFFNTRGGVSHVGIYLGNNYFVHSSAHGVTISSLTEDYYNRKFIGGGRIASK